MRGRDAPATLWWEVSCPRPPRRSARHATRESGSARLLRDERGAPRRAVDPRGRAPARRLRAERARATRRPTLAAPARAADHAPARAAALGRRRARLRRGDRRRSAVAIVAVIVAQRGLRVRRRSARRSARSRRCSAYLPQQALGAPRRAARRRSTQRELVPGRRARCSRRATGSRPTRACSRARVEVDLSTLTGESQPVLSLARSSPTRPGRCSRRATSSSAARRCVGGDAKALVFATGMQTELGRIAALSERVEQRAEPARARRCGASPG